MQLEFRAPTEDERRPAMAAAQAAFGSELEDAEFERERKSLPLDRMDAAFDRGRPVGLTAAYPFELTIPGGQVATAGVTWVGVLPSHRRRGILSELMRRQLEDVHRRGEPLAALWASEAAIYGRFGYGVATVALSLDADRSRFALRDGGAPGGFVRLVERAEALELFPPVYERVRPHVPGMLTRGDHWWAEHRLGENKRPGALTRFHAAVEVDGAVAGYAFYRVDSKWKDGFPTGRLKIDEAMATSPAAARELWRFLFGIDLVERVWQEYLDPASPLPLLVRDLRRLGLRATDGLWLRLVDVEGALRARSYAGGDTVVLDLRDELCPWNAGRWRVGADVGRTDDAPDLALDVADLASAYLGAFDLRRLASAGLVTELTTDAAGRASALFRTARPPYCPEEF